MAGHKENDPIPKLQKLYDSPILLLIAGTVTMFAFYTVWGVIEIRDLPMATLP